MLIRRSILVLAFFVLVLMTLLMQGRTLDSGFPAAGTALMLQKDGAAMLRPAQANLNNLRARIERMPNAIAPRIALISRLFELSSEKGDVYALQESEQLIVKILEMAPDQPEALMYKSRLLLQQHRFQQAAEIMQGVVAKDSTRAAFYGVLADALAETGRYPAAVAAVEKMMALRPDIGAYARTAWMRELHGDTPGAIVSMRMAVKAGVPGSYATESCRSELAALHFGKGDWEIAAALWQQVLATRPGFSSAHLGIAKVHAAQGSLDMAITAVEALIAHQPAPQPYTLLAQLKLKSGKRDAANQAAEMALGMLKAERAAGILPELELAQLLTDCGDLLAPDVALAEAACASRPTIDGYSTLAWMYYRAGQPEAAWQQIQKALLTGKQDALLAYRAGMIAHANGRLRAARLFLESALDLNRAFSVLETERAQAILQEISS